MSTLTPTSQDSDATVVSAYAVSRYERFVYYNGINGYSDHPDLLYRSDLFTNPFPKPAGPFPHVPTKSVYGVYNTSLNKVWDTVGPQIRDLVKDRKVRYSSIDPARFVTYGEYEKTLGPVVIWIGVYPGSTSPDTAHEVSQDILALLVKNSVEGAVVEWREAVPSQLAGPALMRATDYIIDPTTYVRRIFTPALNVPLAAKEMEEEDTQGSLTLYFHEGKDKDGNPSDKVLGVSSCHVLRKNTDVDYEFKGPDASKNYVRVNGRRRFQQGLDDIRSSICRGGTLGNLFVRQIVMHEAKENPGRKDMRALREARKNLLEQQNAIPKLEAFYDEVKNQWSDPEHRNIGHVRYAKAISVDVEGRTLYTEDWAAFEVDEAKVRPRFEGTVVDLDAF